MPVYEYRCKKCGNLFELLRRMLDIDEEVNCPECGEKSPERIFSLFGSKSSGAGCAPGFSAGST